MDDRYFAVGMNGDEDLGQDIIMKGNKFHYGQEVVGREIPFSLSQARDVNRRGMSRYDHGQNQAAPLPVPNNWNGVFQLKQGTQCLTWDNSSITYLGGNTHLLGVAPCANSNKKQLWFWDNETATLRAAAKSNYVAKSKAFGFKDENPDYEAVFEPYTDTTDSKNMIFWSAKDNGCPVKNDNGKFLQTKPDGTVWWTSTCGA
jgi:hypothetical protein